MSSSQEKLENTSVPQLSTPSLGQLLLLFLLLGWFVLAPILTGSLAALLPATWSSLVSRLSVVVVLSGLLLIPFAGFAILVYARRWNNLRPFALALLMTSLYIIIAVIIRTVAEPAETAYELPLLSEATLRLTLLTFAALGIGSFGLWRAGISFSPEILPRVFGFNIPRLTGLLTTLGLIALLTIGWPIAGALGDSWVSLLILIQTLAITLPEEIFFRGAILGLITYNFQHRKTLAALAALLIYVAFTPGLIVPHNDWSKLLLLISAIPFALMMTELRALTGSIWAGILFAWAYRAAPLLFTDPRVELAQIVQPWQTTAHLWMFIGTGGLALVLFGSRKWLAPRWPLASLTVKVATLGTALFFWGLWVGLWIVAGRPGFHNDGFLIIMAEQTDLSGAEKIDDPLARRAFVRERLIETAEKTQAPVRQALEAASLSRSKFGIESCENVTKE